MNGLFRKPAPREQCFDALRALLYRWAPPLETEVDEPQHYSLNTYVRKKTGTPVRFGSVRVLKTYVSLRFAPLDVNPELARGLSPELQARRQGKYSFNFNEPDEQLFAELKVLVRRGYEDFVIRGYIGEIAPQREYPG